MAEEKKWEKVFVIYYFFESNSGSEEMFQSIFRTQEEVDDFLENYKGAIELFEVREDYRHIIY